MINTTCSSVFPRFAVTVPFQLRLIDFKLFGSRGPTTIAAQAVQDAQHYGAGAEWQRRLRWGSSRSGDLEIGETPFLRPNADLIKNHTNI